MRWRPKRKHSALFYVRSVSSQVWNHPGNRGGRVRAVSRAVWWQVRKRLSSRPVVVELPRGARMLCYRDNTVASQIWYFGPYTEYDELLFMTRYLRPGDGVVDAGANIGLYTLLAAPIVGPEGRIDAFEPGETVAERFAENVAVNGFEQVHLHRKAVSDRPGQLSFTTGWDVSNAIVPHGTVGPGSVLVSATTLDEALLEGGYAYAKLDLEGAEALALKGASRLLAQHDPRVWQIEVYEHMLRRYGSSPNEVLGLLQKNGYLLATYEADTNTLKRAEFNTRPKNLLAVAEESWDFVVRRLTEMD